MANTESRLEQALAHHQAGNLDAAEPIYRSILREQPGHADALYLLGTLCFQRGSLGSAALFLRKALAAKPDHAEAHSNLGLVLQAQGKLAEAVGCYEKALALKPDYVDASFNLANARREMGDIALAEQGYRGVLKRRPDFAQAHDNLGITLRELGRLEEALASSQRAIDLDPSLASAHNNRGVILKALNRPTEAIACFQQAIAQAPEFAAAYSNLGATLAEQGRFAEAQSACRQAVALNPDSAAAHNNLGSVLRTAGKYAEAVSCLARAVQLDPSLAEAHNHLGVCLGAVGQLAEAIAAHEEALRLQPDQPVYLRDLATLYCEHERLDDAGQCFLRLAGDRPERRLWRLRAQLLCPTVFESAEHIDEYRAGLEEALEAFPPLQPSLGLAQILPIDCRLSFNLPFHGRDERPIREHFAAIFARCFPQESPPARTGIPRVGFVVTDRHERAFLKSIGGLLERFDPDRLEATIVCAPTGIDQLRGTIRNPKVRYLVLPRHIDQVEAAVREAKLDLLYHWEIGTDALDYFLPFCRLAPTQCTSWGIQVTSGIPAVNCYISSTQIEVPEADAHYSERLARLQTMLAYQQCPASPTQKRGREHFAFSGADRIYLCPQHLGKFHPDFDPVLREILERDPHGRLVITAGRRPAVLAQLQARFKRHLGRVADRVVFLPQQRGDDYHSLLESADVLLDPLHFGGVNTTYDALAQGKAIVTLPSVYHRGRYTLGCYKMMGLTDCVATSPQEYVELALRIAGDRDSREELEQKIRQASNVLFENTAAVRELQEFLVSTIEEHRSRQ